MTLAILCSGQGQQHDGMFALTGAAPEAAGIFASATSLLGDDPRSWIRTAESSALHANRTAQLLCTLQALSAAVMLADVLPRRRCVAGYSVGELAAWGVAGLISPLETLDLIVARSDAMDTARKGEQGMLFVRGLTRAAVDRLCEGRKAAVAIVNPGDAYVLGGLRSALDDIAVVARRQGAMRVVSLGVEVASHTRFMTEATAVFRNRLVDTPMSSMPSGTRLFSGIDGEAVLDIEASADKLARQISQPIQWANCLEACVEAGSRAFLELGPGRALVDAAASAYPGIPARSIDDFKSLEGVREWLKRMDA